MTPNLPGWGQNEKLPHSNYIIHSLLKMPRVFRKKKLNKKKKNWNTLLAKRTMREARIVSIISLSWGKTSLDSCCLWHPPHRAALDKLYKEAPMAVATLVWYSACRSTQLPGILCSCTFPKNILKGNNYSYVLSNTGEHFGGRKTVMLMAAHNFLLYLQNTVLAYWYL